MNPEIRQNKQNKSLGDIDILIDIYDRNWAYFC